MSFDSPENIPIRVKVAGLLSSRYNDHQRPDSWDDRLSGNDVVLTDDDLKLKLRSDGGQSPPKPGWVILITAGDEQQGYDWTLYSIPSSN